MRQVDQPPFLDLLTEIEELEVALDNVATLHDKSATKAVGGVADVNILAKKKFDKLLDDEKKKYEKSLDDEKKKYEKLLDDEKKEYEKSLDDEKKKFTWMSNKTGH